MAAPHYPCLYCGQMFETADGFSAIPRVTSDSKPFRADGQIGQCHACGHVQKPLTEELKSDLKDVYGDYSMFSQSAELAEQAVFDKTGKAGTSRSHVIVQHVKKYLALPTGGVFLDVGAGTGCFMEAFGQAFPRWQLHAQDLDDRYKSRLASVPNFAGFHTGGLDTLEGSFDAIGLSHALEHFLDPVVALRLLAKHLKPGGALFIQVPDIAENVFDLAVCDHISHFTAATLASVAESAGFAKENIKIWLGVVSKQLTMVISPRKVWEHKKPDSPYSLKQGITALLQYKEAYERFVAEYDQIAVFGVATAATWFASIDQSKIAYFVDEDESRAGSTHLGIPVVSPAALPKAIPVFMESAPAAMKHVIADRMAKLGLTMAETPNLKRAAG